MDDQSTDRDPGDRWCLVTPANRRPHVLPFCIFLLLCSIVWCALQPNFWNVKGFVGMCLVVAILILDKLRVKPKDF
jgi:hypothetical protein